MTAANSAPVSERLHQILRQRVMVLDGAMGTSIQGYPLDEADFRKGHFEDHPSPLKGNNDLLSLTRPDIIEQIHDSFFAVGCDFACTNAFSATTIAQADYGLEYAVRDINIAAAQCARRSADRWTEKTPDQPRFVVGCLGPTNRTASISPDVNDPGKRLVSFDDLVTAYRQAAEALVEGGVDIIMVETVFDTLNAKAAVFAVLQLKQERGLDLPLMVSGTITDASGRTLSGQTPEAFWVSLQHGELFSIGLNCALGAEDMLPHIIALDKHADCLVSAHPNAGLPNEFGEYDQDPAQMAAQVEPFLAEGHVNIIGGCCGTTPAHLAELKALADRYTPRQPKAEVVDAD
ncbi:homocysteine S-methyltransferase family protein [Saccharospirillum mangrovi]|uniref:homocysteine S-methyltransferase family protein n=1 Tax=Saccharospirillum mangrovi TaxID=2161747 RepID=UPI0027961BE8|nr:homocysteine S-methyltransferase family protein [Saccharospirillum mangrovi]